MRSGSLYYASDKALFDALNQHKFTNQDIQKLFFKRGMITSKNTDRKELSKHFCRLTHDYYDHENIASTFGSTSKREKISNTTILNTIEDDTIEEILGELKNDIQSQDELFDIESTEDGFNIKLKYKVVDYNKSEFKQVSDKIANITIEKEGSGWSIRGPLNEYTNTIKDSFLDKVAENIDDELDTKDINLLSIRSSEKRTQFFKDLIENINGYQLVDVSDVFVFHPEGYEMEEEDEEDYDEQISGVHIKKASLKGQQVLISDELQSLYDRGFYITKIIWTVMKNGSSESDKYELEAQFTKPQDCTDFSYLVRGFFKYNEDGSYNTSKTNASTEEEKKFSRLLEKAAEKALELAVEDEDIETDN